MRRSRWLAVARTPMGACAAVLLVLVIAVAILAPILWGHRAAAVDTNALQQGPSGAHLLGTDSLGRDIFYRVLVATRLSMELAVLATLIGVVTGLVLGTAPSVLPRWAGRLVTAVVNLAVAFPGLLLALFFAVIFGIGAEGALLAIGLASAPAFARLVRTLSAELVGRGIRVNAVSPGPIATPILNRLGLPPEALEETKNNLADQVPMKRFGRPEEIAKTVLFLASADSSFLLGTEIIADGGMSQL